MIRGYCINGHKLSDNPRTFSCPKCARNERRRYASNLTVTILRRHLRTLYHAVNRLEMGFNRRTYRELRAARNHVRRALGLKVRRGDL